jgi:hypothetical protein
MPNTDPMQQARLHRHHDAAVNLLKQQIKGYQTTIGRLTKQFGAACASNPTRI